MENWKKDARSEAIITDLEALVPQDHLLRKIEKVMDYDWLYERLDPYNHPQPFTFAFGKINLQPNHTGKKK